MSSAQEKNVLVVEDEMLLAMHVEDMLRDMGHHVVGPATRVDAALRLVAEQRIDFAILDVGIGEGESFAVADLLRAKGIPFVFATGYGSTALPALYRSDPMLEKPFEERDLEPYLGRAGIPVC